jgi:GTP1/Obg family GTP-binding protein
MRVWKMIAAIFIFAASLAVLSPVVAQQSPNKGATIEETHLRSFAKAYAEVQKIREFYEAQLGTAQDPQKSSEIEREARSKITAAIGREGLTLDSYSQIVQTANADESLRKRIIELINEEKKNSQTTP